MVARALLSDADISSSPNDAGIRLGGLSPEGRIPCAPSSSVSLAMSLPLACKRQSILKSPRGSPCQNDEIKCSVYIREQARIEHQDCS